MTEIWWSVPGFEGLYEASNLGRIKSLDRMVPGRSKSSSTYMRRSPGGLLHPTVGRGGYLFVGLSKDGTQGMRSAHSVIAETFLGPRPAERYTCHRDGNPANNALANLYYGTPSENVADARRHGTLSVGERAGSAKLSEADVRFIRAHAGVLSQSAMAARFGVGQSQISRIVSGIRWAHLDTEAA